MSAFLEQFSQLSLATAQALQRQLEEEEVGFLEGRVGFQVCFFNVLEDWFNPT
jgi:hypothetical protein